MSEEEVKREQTASKGNKICCDSSGEAEKTKEVASKHQSIINKREENRKPFVCAICGKGFNSLVSLKRHVASTGHKGGADAYVEKRPTPPPSPARRPSPMEEMGVPDPYQHLKQTLKVFGLSERDASAVVKFMEPYGVDDLYKLVEAASTYMPRTRLRLFIESWANIRRIPIPPEIEEELGLNIEHPRYGYGYSPYIPRRRPRYENEVDDRDPTLFAIGRELGELRASLKGGAGGAENSPILQHILDRLSALEEKIAYSNDGELSALKERLARLEDNVQLQIKRIEIEATKEIEKQKLEIAKETLTILKNIQQSFSERGDLLTKALISMGTGRPIPLEDRPPREAREEAPDFDEVAEKYLPPELIESEEVVEK